MDNKKYLSIVYTGRNDNYAKGFISRFQNSLFFLSYLSKKHNFDKDIEIIIVEWNPLPKEKRLKDVLSLPKNIDVRIIEVPNGIHKKVPATLYDADNANSIPFYEFIGKNVAMRRATTPFMLCSNPDIILNDSLMEYLSKKQLSSKHFYRIDRDNLIHDVAMHGKVGKILKRCEADLDSKSQAKNAICRKRFVHTKASGDFLLMSTDLFRKMKGYLEIRTGGGALDRFGVYCASTVGKQIILDPPMRIFHQPHAKRCEVYQKKVSPESVNMEYSSAHATFGKRDTKHWFENSLKRMELTGKNLNVNKVNWGLKEYELSEEFFERSE